MPRVIPVSELTVGQFFDWKNELHFITRISDNRVYVRDFSDISDEDEVNENFFTSDTPVHRVNVSISWSLA